MTYAKKICGIYQIETPKGNKYIGSSTNVHQRWAEHRTTLKHRKHHSTRLQAAYDKYGLSLAFSILEECNESELNVREQHYIDTLGATLNTSTFVANVWLNVSTREKFRKIHSSAEYRAQRSEIARRNKKSWRPVDCSDGRKFESMSEAAAEFGVTASHIKVLAGSQHLGRLNVRFKFADEVWRPLKTFREKIMDTRRRNNTVFSAKTRARMRAAKKGTVPSQAARVAAVEAQRRPVWCLHKVTGERAEFVSITEAAKAIRPDDYRRIRAQITKACSGVKPSAYGYIWGYAERGAA